MRYLAIDLGAKRTGLAIGNDETLHVSPIRVLEASGEELLRQVENEVRAQGAGAIVVGLPLNMDGTEGRAAKQSREFAREVAARAGVAAHLQDERLTTHAAEEHLKQSGRTRGEKKAIRDALAAAEILADFLEQRSKRPEPS